MSQGKTFRQAVTNNHPLQIPGVINAYNALMAEDTGFHAIYLSGGGVANNSYAVADTGITTLKQVLSIVKPITAAVNLPLLVDIDTGFGNTNDIATTIKDMISADVAAVHIEDQVEAKLCGHLDGKQLVSTAEMVDRIKACVDAKTDPNFVIMARTDAYALEGLEKTLERAVAYQEAGADMLFIEALPEINLYRQFHQAVTLPILANITEFGKTPLYTTSELYKNDVSMVLYPRTIDRIMSKAAHHAMQEILSQGTQETLLEKMQTREELYDFLKYNP